MSDEVVVHRRADGVRELRVNGVFVVDDVETSSERRLAQLVLERDARDVLVGGLGLGHTVRTLLTGPDVRRVIVAELHAEVVEAVDADLLADSRLDVVVTDVRDLVAGQPQSSVDAVLLDVDNGPDFLVHVQNAPIYADAFVAACARIMRPGGTLAVWSMADSPALRATVGRHLGDVEVERVPVRLQQRDEAYWILSARRRGVTSPGLDRPPR